MKVVRTDHLKNNYNIDLSAQTSKAKSALADFYRTGTRNSHKGKRGYSVKETYLTTETARKSSSLQACRSKKAAHFNRSSTYIHKSTTQISVIAKREGCEI